MKTRNRRKRSARLCAPSTRTGAWTSFSATGEKLPHAAAASLTDEKRCRAVAHGPSTR